MNDDFDVIIIGTGAGDVAASDRADGKRILVLERGPFVPREKDRADSELDARPDLS